MTTRQAGIAASVTALAVAIGCHDPGSGEDATDDATADVDGEPLEPPFPFVRCEGERAPLPALVEDRRVYQQDSLEVWTIHLTVDDLEGLAAVNEGVEGAEVPVHFTDGVFGADATAPNGILRIRGGASRRNVQKNFKVKLASSAGLWRGQKDVNLNKHMWDLTRLRNKLAFDIFQTIPDFTSMRTQFVHLFINGDDYGLFTWIEEGDKRFLRNHGLDPDGQLYKAAAFHFQELAPEVREDPIALRYHVEPKANPDPDKFLRMLDAVRDFDRDIDEVVDVYFNRDNLVTWLAVNVLINNIDTRTQNYYLYSPSSCEGWYFLPWDYDGAWGFYAQRRPDSRDRWESGLSNWWPVHLFKRFFQKPANVDAIHARIVALSETVLTDAVTEERLAGYRGLVADFVTRMPDLAHLPARPRTPEGAQVAWEEEVDRIASTVSRFRAEYETVIERPMPAHMAAKAEVSPLRFRWDHSFDLQDDPITYDLQIATTPLFEPGEVLVDQRDLAHRETTVPSLPPGTYYWRVIIRDHKTADSWQLPYQPYKVLFVD
jgi:hypothetical protein